MSLLMLDKIHIKDFVIKYGKSGKVKEAAWSTFKE